MAALNVSKALAVYEIFFFRYKYIDIILRILKKKLYTAYLELSVMYFDHNK